ncbi:hypothetical protein OIU78_023606 [Salix suchowensis]|nr:hypothetical protein OIU78_023606 [Salix suchowensis]
MVATDNKKLISKIKIGGNGDDYKASRSSRESSSSSSSTSSTCNSSKSSCRICSIWCLSASKILLSSSISIIVMFSVFL